MPLRQVESWDDTLVLHAGMQSRVRVQVSSIGGYLHDWTGTIERLDCGGRHCFIDGHMVGFHCLIRLATPGGEVIENPNSMKFWKAAIEQRAAEKKTTERVRNDEWFVPQSGLVRILNIVEVPVLYSGRQITAYLATHKHREVQILIRAKNKELARRALELSASGENFWTISGAMLKGGVLWLPWHQMMIWWCKKAEEVRRGMPPLEKECTYEQDQERFAWYEDNGLKVTDYASAYTSRVFETYTSVDWEALFQWADGKSAKALADFMTKAWSSNEYLSADGGELGFETTQTLKAAGLIEWEPAHDFSLRELAEYVSVKELRAWIVEAGSAFKAKGGDALRNHLFEISPQFLEERLRKLTPARRLRMVQPSGWTWEEFQVIRKLYRAMTEDMQSYQAGFLPRDKAGPYLAPNFAAN